MKLIHFVLTDEEYQRLTQHAASTHERINHFHAEHDLPQLGDYGVNEFARARLFVALEMDEEIAVHLSKMPTPNGGGRP